MPEAIFCQWLSWKHWNTHVYQVSPPCIVWCASLRSEEVVIGKSARGNFLSVVVMETLKYTCVPSFTSTHCMVYKFGKWSSYRKKVPEAIFCSWLSWKSWNTHVYQVSPPRIVWCGLRLGLIMEAQRYTCVQILPLWFASLRSEEVQWNLRREDTLGTALLSSLRRLSSSRRLFNICLVSPPRMIKHLMWHGCTFYSYMN